MSSKLVPILLFFIIFTDARAEREPSNLVSLGSTLSPTKPPTSWFSPSGLFAFGFYPKGNGFAVGIWLVEKQNNTVVWTANRDDPPISSNATIEFTRDGWLILLTEQGAEQRIADASEPAATASMLDSGNFVLQNNDSHVIWESFDFPTDTILGGQNLSSGSNLVSSASSLDHSSGRFFLGMQQDGNLVAYPVNSSAEPDDAYWSSGTFGIEAGVQRLSLDPRGLLYLGSYSSNIHTLANCSSPEENDTVIYRAILDADGMFRLFSHHFDNNMNSVALPEWSMLQHYCQVSDFCGLNSYCSGTGTKADCNCYPGFDFVDPNKKFLGCQRNFSEDLCASAKDSLMLYNITPMEDLEWGDYPYYVASLMKEDCEHKCREDCNCGASLYFNGTCKKYKLPIRYGRLNLNNSATAFFKVMGLGSATVGDRTPPIPTGPIVVIERKKNLILILVASLGSIAGLCFSIAISSFLAYRRRLQRHRKPSDYANLGQTEEFTLRSFSYQELAEATDGFKEELGKGSYGAVYRGILSGSGKNVAVKRVENVLEEAEREFRSEMTAIGRTHHRNLVRLLGFCVEGSKKLLVYEYMSNGSLADLLFKVGRLPSWGERMKIILDVARGILYLHEECEVCIIHGGIKPKNILMDDSGSAKISDFGLARLLMPNEIGAISGNRETREYSAPEWQKNASVSVKSDIYSFGIVLLELVCCRSNIEVNVSTADEIMLSTWVYKCFVAGELYKLVKDEDVDVDLKMLERVIKVGLWCIQDDPDLRPYMKNVILMLEGRIDTPTPPFLAPFP